MARDGTVSTALMETQEITTLVSAIDAGKT